MLSEQQVHLAILDVMMPGKDGLTLCRELRQDSNIPVLMLSARSQDIGKIMGLTTGADDYLAKSCRRAAGLPHSDRVRDTVPDHEEQGHRPQLRGYLRIREKVEENPSEPEFIKTVWGVGYRIDT